MHWIQPMYTVVSQCLAAGWVHIGMYTARSRRTVYLRFTRKRLLSMLRSHCLGVGLRAFLLHDVLRTRMAHTGRHVCLSHTNTDSPSHDPSQLCHQTRSLHDCPIIPVLSHQKITWRRWRNSDGSRLPWTLNTGRCGFKKIAILNVWLHLYPETIQDTRIWKANRKSYMIYRTVSLLMILNDLLSFQLLNTSTANI